MDLWRINLEVGDFIVWRDEAIELEGQPVEPGMKGKVISLAFTSMSPRSNPFRPGPVREWHEADGG